MLIFNKDFKYMLSDEGMKQQNKRIYAMIKDTIAMLLLTAMTCYMTYAFWIKLTSG